MISFGDFRLDRRTRRLRYRGSERPLRAKSSAVLLYLAEHPNRLVTHAELLRAAWPGVTVSPTVLRVCIREIRAALGADAEQLLTTVPRRGYRFTVEPGAASAVFVGREAEKAALYEALARAQSGRRQVVLVAGESGAGKTALLDDFLEALRADGDVRCARGQALALQGRVEGCAPVLDLLSRLCDEAEGAAVVEALARWAPGWLLQLPGRVDDATAASLRERASIASWDARLLELGEVVEHLASAKPLVLVLEDLHWSDASTLDALAYLTRRTVAARLLVVASFQPDALGPGHPFVETRERLRARGLATEIALDGKWTVDGGGRRFTPESPAAAPDDADLDAERRQLTVMSCHLVGASDLAERLDPEDLRSLVRAHQESASAVVQRYEGHVAQYLVDGFLAYFCYPQAHEDDAERAVRAGLDVLTALQGLNESLAAEHGIRLALRIGIHTGPVVIGEMGGGAKRDMIALGDVPHMAARVQSAAEPDSVVVTAATQRLVAGLFVTEDRGAHQFEGLRQPIALHRVVRPSGVRGRVAAATGRLTPFVGREREMATLLERWEAARQGAGQRLVVLADAGVGKSRLTHQLRQHLTATPHTWLEAGATPYTAGTPFHPVRALLTEALAFAAEDGGAERLARIERALGRLASAETVALIAELLGLPPPTPLEMSPELRRWKTIELLARWLHALSALQPTVLLVEDLHWCDPSSLELLGHLVAQSATSPLLLLLTARPEFTPPWTGEQATTLTLARLSEEDTRDMVRTLVGESLPARTVDALVARSDGVPLYVEELTKSLAELGPAQTADAIPATLADSLMARLDRLSAAKEVAQRAAVLGREFAHPLLAAVSGLDDATLRRELGRLVEAEIVFARGEPPDATYAFKHALIQETAYQSLLKRTRQQLHARTGRALEARFPERARAEPEVVARHYEQAGLSGAAIAHYQRAGERAAERSANEEAIGHLRRALALVATEAPGRERDTRELQLQTAIATPLGAARGFGHPESEASYARARALATALGASTELPRVLMGLATVYYVKGDLASGDAVAHETMAAAERTRDPLDLLLAHVVVGFPFFYRGHFARALEHYGRATELYDPDQHASFARTLGWDRGVNAHAYLAWCLLYLGHHDRARAMTEKAIALAKRAEHPLSLANVLLHAAVHYLERRDAERALALSSELIALAEPHGFPMFVGAGRFFRGCAWADSGDDAAGIAEMEAALGELAKIGTGIGAPGFLTLFGDRLRRVGRYDEALVFLGLGLDRSSAQGAPWVDAELHRLHAETLLDKGDAPDEAEARLARALEIARSQENRFFELRVAMGLARVRQRQGRRDEARALLAPVLAWFSEGFDLRDLRDARALLDELA